VSSYALTFGGFCCSRGAVALFDRRRDECEEAASKGEIRSRTTLTWL
jgi:hypothetical protein